MDGIRRQVNHSTNPDPRRRKEGSKMCKLRTNIVRNCKKCKSSVRLHCPERKKVRTKRYVDTPKKGEHQEDKR